MRNRLPVVFVFLCFLCFLSFGTCERCAYKLGYHDELLVETQLPATTMGERSLLGLVLRCCFFLPFLYLRAMRVYNGIS